MPTRLATSHLLLHCLLLVVSLLLPGTAAAATLVLDATPARSLARQGHFRSGPTTVSGLGIGADPVWLHASLGVATRDQHYSLADLIQETDTWLQCAKHSGHNQVCSVDTAFAVAKPG